jgi:hypothetical protein
MVTGSTFKNQKVFFIFQRINKLVLNYAFLSRNFSIILPRTENFGFAILDLRRVASSSVE